MQLIGKILIPKEGVRTFLCKFSTEQMAKDRFEILANSLGGEFIEYLPLDKYLENGDLMEVTSC